MRAIRCKCGCIYPDDMAECPTCRLLTKDNDNYVISESINFGQQNKEITQQKAINTRNVYSYTKSMYAKNSADGNNRSTKKHNLTPCPACNDLISKKAESCPHCGQPTGVHVCPKCQSTNTKVISGASKATSIFLWGPFAANKVVSKFQCKDCGHKW